MATSSRPTDGISSELDVAVGLARAAGAVVLRYYGTTDAEHKTTAHGITSPVTAADRAAERVIGDGLREAFPDDAILSEEAEDTTARLEAERVWIVDPLDGTKEFLARNGEFSVMIGLAVRGEAMLGVVYRPTDDVLYAAERGRGTWVEKTGRKRRRLRCRPADLDDLRLVGSRSHGDPLLRRMRDALGITDVMPSGSVGVKCGLIAEGKRDLYVHPVPYLKEWDTCAPEVVLREAGGDVCDCLGEPLRYNKPDPRQPDGIVACGGGVRADIIDGIARLYREKPSV